MVRWLALYTGVGSVFCACVTTRCVNCAFRRFTPRLCSIRFWHSSYFNSVLVLVSALHCTINVPYLFSLILSKCPIHANLRALMNPAMSASCHALAVIIVVHSYFPHYIIALNMSSRKNTSFWMCNFRTLSFWLTCLEEYMSKVKSSVNCVECIMTSHRVETLFPCCYRTDVIPW